MAHKDKAKLAAKLAKHMPATIPAGPGHKERALAADTILLDVVYLPNGGRHVISIGIDDFISVVFGDSPPTNLPLTASGIVTAASTRLTSSGYDKYIERWKNDGTLDA